MENMHILMGFDAPEFEQVVKNLLKLKGYEAQIHSKLSKLTIKEYLERNPSCTAVVLKETFSKDVYYTAEEVAQLTDMRDVNVIIVLSEKRRGTDYMRTLYTAGITNAIFQKGRRGGATPKEVATLLLQRRTRKAAREYYGIASKKIELGFLDTATYVEFYQDLKQGDKSLLENYIAVCARMSPQQIADFTRRLPKDDQEHLAQFKEFHAIMQLLKKFGIDLKIKKPKKLQIGLEMPIGISLKEDAIHFDTMPKKKDDSAVQKKEEKDVIKEVSIEVAEQDVTKDMVKDDDAILGMSLSAIFGYETDGSGEMDNKEQPKEYKLDDIDISRFFTGSDYQETDVPVKETDAAVTSGKSGNVEDEVKEESVEKAVDDFITKMNNVEEKTAAPEGEVKDNTQNAVMDSEEEDVPQEIISFGDYDEAYDEISLDSGAGQHVSIPLVIAILFLLLAAVGVFVFGNARITQLF